MFVISGPAPPAGAEDSAQPDALIRTRPGEWVGDDIYGRPHGQARVKKVAPGDGKTFFVMVQNDGTGTDTFALKGCHEDWRFKVSYSSDATNITDAVVAGTYEMTDLAPGASDTIRLRIRARWCEGLSVRGRTDLTPVATRG